MAAPETGKDGTAQRILEATIECIEESGLEGVTVRKIAARAGVNVAAVNYHFGSKAALLERALDLTLDNAFSLQELDEYLAEGMEVRGAVERFVAEYLENAMRWPGIAEAHLHAPLTRGEYPDAVLQKMGAFLAGFLDTVSPLLPTRDREEGMRAVVQLWSAVMFVGLLPGLFRRVGVELGEAEEREAYVRGLLDRYVGTTERQAGGGR